MKKIKAVIFDMDGLMIDSEPFSYQAFNDVFRKYGKHLSEKENTERYVGVSDVDESKDMVVRFSLPISAEELVQAKRACYKQLLEDQVEVQPGLMELLAKLHQNGYKTVIASSSSLEIIEAVIKKFNLSLLINSYASAEEVEHGKPAPDVFLLAAEKLGVSTVDCLVLEDAPKGVQAAKAAGMLCFAIPSNETKGQDFSLADKVLNNLSEVFNLL